MDKRKPIRIDKIVGMLTILVIFVCTLIVFLDVKGGKPIRNPETQAVEETEEEKIEPIVYSEAETFSIGRIRARGYYTVVIDPGHGGTDNGEVSGDAKEKDVTLALCKQVAKFLDDSSVTVVMTREDDKAMTDAERAALCKAEDPDVIFSIYMDMNNASAQAAGGFIHTSSPEDSKLLSDMVLKKMATDLGVTNNGTNKGSLGSESTNYYLNDHCSATSMVLQIGSINNPADVKLYGKDINKAASAIADGIVAYLNTL